MHCYAPLSDALERAVDDAGMDIQDANFRYIFRTRFSWDTLWQVLIFFADEDDFYPVHLDVRRPYHIAPIVPPWKWMATLDALRRYATELDLVENLEVAEWSIAHDSVVCCW